MARHYWLCWEYHSAQRVISTGKPLIANFKKPRCRRIDLNTDLKGDTDGSHGNNRLYFRNDGSNCIYSLRKVNENAKRKRTSRGELQGMVSRCLVEASYRRAASSSGLTA